MVLKQLFIAGSLSFTLALQGWGQVPAEHDTVQANYELAEKFHKFTLGGKLSNNSMSLYPHEINDTDNFGLILRLRQVNTTIMSTPRRERRSYSSITRKWLCCFPV